MSQRVSDPSIYVLCSELLHANDIIAEDKNNNLMSSEGMEATEEEMQSSFADEEAIMDAE